MTSTSTLSSQDRIITVDALRGIALFGILYAHMIYWYSAGPLPQRMYGGPESDIASNIASGIYGLLFFAKFFSFFSFLFGLSFFLQMKSFEKRDESFLTRYGWRLLILGIIGLIHHAFWRGDILSIYVPLGFVLIFARNLSNKMLLILGFILILNIPTKLYEGADLIWSIKGTSTFDFKKESDLYYNIIKNGSLLDVIKYNLETFVGKFDFQISSGRLIITFGFFLIGMYVGRKKWFENLDSMKPVIKNVWKKTSFVLLGILGVGILMAVGVGLKFLNGDDKWLQWSIGFLFDIFNAALTIFYISGLTLMMYKVRWQKLLYPLAPIGKMALTSYLTQTFFGLLIFYSFGFGLFDVTSPAINSLIGIGIFSLQVLLSTWWLRHFSYGPVEWVWRSLTFFKLQPIARKSKIAPAVVPMVVEK